MKPASVGDYALGLTPTRTVSRISDEPAMPGITATIVDASGNPVSASGHPVSAVTTGADGKYKFENLLPGDCVLHAGWLRGDDLGCW